MQKKIKKKTLLNYIVKSAVEITKLQQKLTAHRSILADLEDSNQMVGGILSDHTETMKTMQSNLADTMAVINEQNKLIDRLTALAEKHTKGAKR